MPLGYGIGSFSLEEKINTSLLPAIQQLPARDLIQISLPSESLIKQMACGRSLNKLCHGSHLQSCSNCLCTRTKQMKAKVQDLPWGGWIHLAFHQLILSSSSWEWRRAERGVVGPFILLGRMPTRQQRIWRKAAIVLFLIKCYFHQQKCPSDNSSFRGGTFIGTGVADLS